MIYLPVFGAVKVPRLSPLVWLGIVLGLGVYLYLLECAFQLALGDQGCRIAFGMLSGWCGSKTGIAMAVAIIFLPPAVIVSLKRPWIFPIAFYAFLVPSDSYLNITSGGSVTKLVGAMGILALLFWIARKRRVVNPGSSTAMWIGYFLWSTASLLWAFTVSPEVIAYYSTFVMLIALYLVLVITPVSEDEFKLLLGAFIIGSCVAAAFGAIVFSGGHMVNQGRLKGHFDSENKLSSDFFAASLIFPIGATVMAALRERMGMRKIVFLIAFAILMVGQYVVGARGAIVADAALFAYFFWKSRYRVQLIFVSVCGLLVSLLYPSVWMRFISPDSHGGDNGGSGRIPIWKVGIVALKHYWLFGAGMDNFAYVYNKYFLSVWNTFDTHWSRGPHNVLLQAAVELGVVGTVLLVLGWWFTFKSASHIPVGHRLYDLRIIIEGGVLGTFVNAQFVHIMHEKFTWWMFAMVIMARTMSLGVMQKERIVVAGDARAGPTSTSVLPPPPILERTL